MHWKRFVLGFALLLLLAGIGFVVWGSTPAGPMEAAGEGLQSDGQVSVQAGNWLVFTPVSAVPETGLIFYPGGWVDYRSYAPFARILAARGYMVVIPRMPLSLAVITPDAADEVITAYPNIRAWAIGGHSLGGAMAAHYALQHPGQIRGLFLEASYPPEGDDLSKLDLAATSVYGTRDGVATPDEVRAAAPRLPADTRWVAIEGGNHAGFGWYGAQARDGEATISRNVQQARAATAAIDLLERIQKK